WPASTATTTSRSPSAGACSARTIFGTAFCALANAAAEPSSATSLPSATTRRLPASPPANHWARAGTADFISSTIRSVPSGRTPVRTVSTRPTPSGMRTPLARRVRRRSMTTRLGRSSMNISWDVGVEVASVMRRPPSSGVSSMARSCVDVPAASRRGETATAPRATAATIRASFHPLIASSPKHLLNHELRGNCCCVIYEQPAPNSSIESGEPCVAEFREPLQDDDVSLRFDAERDLNIGGRQTAGASLGPLDEPHVTRHGEIADAERLELGHIPQAIEIEM